MATWTVTKVEAGWLHETLTGDPEWDGYRVTPLPGTLPAPQPVPTHTTPPRPTVTAAGCIPSCTHEGPHERWECEFLATTGDEWRRIMGR